MLSTTFQEVCAECGHWWHRHLNSDTKHSFQPCLSIDQAYHAQQVLSPQHVHNQVSTFVHKPILEQICSAQTNQLHFPPYLHEEPNEKPNATPDTETCAWNYVVKQLEQCSEIEMKDVFEYIDKNPQSLLAKCFTEISNASQPFGQMQGYERPWITGGCFPFVDVERNISNYCLQPHITTFEHFFQPFDDFETRTRLLKLGSFNHLCDSTPITSPDQMEHLLSHVKTPMTFQHKRERFEITHGPGFQREIYISMTGHIVYQLFIEVQVPLWAANLILTHWLGPWACIDKLTISVGGNVFLQNTGTQLWATMQSTNPQSSQWWANTFSPNVKTNTASFFLPIPRPITGNSVTAFMQSVLDIQYQTFNVQAAPIRWITRQCLKNILSPGMNRMICGLISPYCISPTLVGHHQGLNGNHLDPKWVQRNEEVYDAFGLCYQLTRPENDWIQALEFKFGIPTTSVLNVLCFHADGQVYHVNEPHPMDSFQLVYNKGFASEVEDAEHWFSTDKTKHNKLIPTNVRLYTKTFIKPLQYENKPHFLLTKAFRLRPAYHYAHHRPRRPEEIGLPIVADKMTFLCKWSSEHSKPGDYLCMWWLNYNINMTSDGLIIRRFGF